MKNQQKKLNGSPQKDGLPAITAILHQHAERRLQENADASAIPVPSDASLQHRLHELQAHQRELEKQNKELARALAAEVMLGKEAATVNALRQSERCLKESQDTTRRQLEEIAGYYAHAPVGLCILDTHLRYVRINERLAALNGKPVDAHLGRSIHEMAPRVAGQLDLVLRQVLETGTDVTSVEICNQTSPPPHPPHRVDECLSAAG